MKILVLSRVSPIPTNDGERLRAYHLIKQLAKKNDITLICRLLNKEDHAVFEEMATFCKKIIGTEIKERPTLSQKTKRVAPYIFSKKPLSVAAMCFEKIGREINQELKKNEYDLIEIHHSLLSEYIKYIPCHVNPIKVVNLHNLEVIRFPRLYAGAVNWKMKLFYGLEKYRIERFEGLAIRRFDHSLSVSPTEVDEIKRRWPEVNVSLVPNGVGVESIKFRSKQPYNNKIIFVSSFAAQQNIEAAIFLIKKIWPLVYTKKPASELILVGKDPSPTLWSFNKQNGITVTGTVPTTTPYFQNASLCLVPLKTGGGTRLKILEAMAHGIPVVTTSIGAEGIPVKPGHDIEIADSPDDIAKKVLDLMDNPSRCRQIAEAGRRFVEDGFSWDAIGNKLNTLYKNLVNGKAK